MEIIQAEITPDENVQACNCHGSELLKHSRIFLKFSSSFHSFFIKITRIIRFIIQGMEGILKLVHEPKQAKHLKTQTQPVY